MQPPTCARNLVCSIPGIATLTADVKIAETGAPMACFPDWKSSGFCTGQGGQDFAASLLVLIRPQGSCTAARAAAASVDAGSPGLRALRR